MPLITKKSNVVYVGIRGPQGNSSPDLETLINNYPAIKTLAQTETVNAINALGGVTNELIEVAPYINVLAPLAEDLKSEDSSIKNLAGVLGNYDELKAQLDALASESNSLKPLAEDIVKSDTESVLKQAIKLVGTEDSIVQLVADKKAEMEAFAKDTQEAYEAAIDEITDQVVEDATSVVIDVARDDLDKYIVTKHNDLKGDKGDKGDSAYQVAVNNGFEGSEAEWLKSLKASVESASESDIENLF